MNVNVRIIKTYDDFIVVDGKEITDYYFIDYDHRNTLEYDYNGDFKCGKIEFNEIFSLNNKDVILLDNIIDLSDFEKELIIESKNNFLWGILPFSKKYKNYLTNKFDTDLKNSFNSLIVKFDLKPTDIIFKIN